MGNRVVIPKQGRSKVCTTTAPWWTPWSHKDEKHCSESNLVAWYWQGHWEKSTELPAMSAAPKVTCSSTTTSLGMARSLLGKDHAGEQLLIVHIYALMIPHTSKDISCRGPFLQKYFLVVVGARPKWIEIMVVTSTTTKYSIQHLRRIFNTWITRNTGFW